MLIKEFRCICGSNEFKDCGEKYSGMICNTCRTVYDKQTHELIFQSNHSKEIIKKQTQSQQQPKTEQPKLITCPACNQQVSNQAESCPHCGQPINTKPKCPICNSTNIRQIGGVERAGSVWMFGMFSSKINKSWTCNDCKAKW